MAAETPTPSLAKIGRLAYEAARAAPQRFRAKPRIFVGHSTREGTPERATLMRLVDELKQGYDVLLDRTALGADDNWRDMVDRWIRDCDTALVLITPAALASSYSMSGRCCRCAEGCRRFLTRAAARGASIFKMMSRHKSVDTLRGYVRNAELFKDHAGDGPALGGSAIRTKARLTSAFFLEGAQERAAALIRLVV